MAQNLQTFTWDAFNAGIDFYDTKAPGKIYFSHGIDFDSLPGYFRSNNLVTHSLTSATLSAFNANPCLFEALNGYTFMLTANSKLFRAVGHTWANDSYWPHADGNTGVGNGLKIFNQELFWAANTTVGRVQNPTSAVPTFTDSWQTGLTTKNLHPMEVFIGKLMIGHDRYVATWDTTTWTLQALTLPAGYSAISMAVYNDLLAIGCSINGKGAKIFFWDGTSSTYNYELTMPGSEEPGSLLSFGGYLWIASNANPVLFSYNGSSLMEVAKVPPLFLNANINENCLAEYEGKIYFALSNADPQLNLDDRGCNGLWSYNTNNGALNFESLNANNTVYPKSSPVETNSIFNDGTYLRLASVDSGAGVTTRAVDYLSPVDFYEPRSEGAYLITPWFDANVAVKKHFRKFFINFRYFPNTLSGFEITVKYRLDDTEKFRMIDTSSFIFSVGSATATTITVGSPGDTSYFQVGDELTIVNSDGAGNIRRITDISGDVVTVDRAFSTTPTSNSEYVVAPWRELGTANITEDADKTSKSFNFPNNAVGKKIQFKIEVRDADNPNAGVTAISDLSFTFIPKKAI